MITVWSSRYVQTATPLEKPAEWTRGPDHISAASSARVADSPIYKRRRAAIACLNESNTRTRSRHTTISGAVTIDSLHAMPDAQAAMAAADHAARRRGSRARTDA